MPGSDAPDFEPIAIVGRACLLPGGVLSPGDLWTAVSSGRDLLGSAPPGRWGLPPELALCDDPARSADRSWSDRGGYVTGFEERFAAELASDPFARLPSERILGLDPLFQWVLHTARAALRDAGHTGSAARVGAVFGNLSFPSTGLSRFAERTWLGDTLADRAGVPVRDPRDRFMSGGPAALLTQALGLGGGAYALDAACSSSLYAIRLAAEQLQDRTVDLAVAGAVCRSDDLFIHVGFCALNALSKTGQSRPFSAHADGLLPAEGCAFVALKRLADAEAAGDRILGVIRGIGLSNDGRGRGMLAPSIEGQARALRSALQMAGETPDQVSLIECHATGTPVGDATEMGTLTEVYGRREIPIGSLKSNTGHIITAAGVSGLLKVLGAMEHGVRPPTLHAEELSDAVKQSSFRPIRAPERWDDDRRLAGISAFGFGGNNAHLLVEPHQETSRKHVARARRPVPVAVVALGAAAGSAPDAVTFAERLLGPARLDARASEVTLPLTGMKFPPRDLEQTLPQQTLTLQVAMAAAAQLKSPLPRESTGVLIGMEADPEVARYGARWRARDWAPRWGVTDPAKIAAIQEEFVPVLGAAGVIGTMPNIPANRLNAQLDVAGPSFAVSDGEHSGSTALDVALRGLRMGTLDAAIVGAADLSDEPVHLAASRALGDRRAPGDGAFVLVLKRLDDARRDGDDVLAVLDEAAPPPGLAIGSGAVDPSAWFGTPYAANAMLAVAAAVVAVRTGRKPAVGGSTPWTDAERCAEARLTSHAGATWLLRVRSAGPPGPLPATKPITGPVLRLPAHAPTVNSPSVPEIPVQTPAPAVRRTPETRMSSAPQLPPTTFVGPASTGRTGFAPEDADAPAGPPPVVPQAPVVHQPAPVVHHQPAAVQPPTLVHPVAPGAPDAAAAGAWIGQVARLHQEYLAKQAEVHQRFLRMRSTGLTALVNAAAGSTGAPQAYAHPPLPSPTRGEGEVRAVVQPVAPAVQPVAPQPAPMVSPAPSARTGAQAAPAASSPPPAAAVAPPPRPSPTRGEGGTAKAPVKPTGLKSRPDTGQPLPGPKIDRAGLEILASGKISDVFGPAFARQDAFLRQCRMPEPPLLLCDRVTGIDAEPGSMGLGTIWTETDVTKDSWYLHDGAMPQGVMIEAGQADLLLISWLGVDWQNQGKRVYRLLGCDLTYSGGAPRPGDTLKYDIHVDGHARQGDIKLFFFHYDCRVDGQLRLSVRNGQAGFFTDEELLDSGGVLWDAETGEHAKDARVDPPKVLTTRTSFDREQIEAFANGDAFACFGQGFELAQTHVRTPRISPPPMTFFEKVDTFQVRGGPWKRGYLRATRQITPADWTFEGHFKNDPCMPGTLMFEGCLQAASFFLAALGHTLKKDGWRFEVVPDVAYALRCRGQVIPSSQLLTYEVFVEEIHDGPWPTIFADFLCTVDGLKAFHARRVGVQLRPAWPLESRPELLDGYVEPKPVASADGFEYGYASLLACAWGQPSKAFGPFYSPFDQGRACARLPGPPYHFMSRITKIDGPVNGMKVGTAIELEYDIPKDAWYFDENGNATMPYAVLLEAALQPCGWIACFVGSALTTDRDLLFRNLDGTGNLKAELLPHTGTLITRAKLTSISKSGGMIIESFEVTCLVGETVVYELKTVFGFFAPEAFENQVGITPTAEEKAALEATSDFLVDLVHDQPEKFFGGKIILPAPMLLMIDRVDGWWPEGGKKGLGRIRARKDVDPAEWFFKSHFFTDPVQPGSLGIEAMLQTLQWAMIEMNLHEGMENPRFEPIALDVPLTWKYRGQVTPKNKVVTSDLEIVEIVRDERGVTIIADGYLWCDGLRIYGATKMGMRIVDNPNPLPWPRRSFDKRTGKLPTERPAPRVLPKPSPRFREPVSQAAATPTTEVLDPATAPWLVDHRPTWTVPALPAMSMVDRLVRAARTAHPGREPTGLTDVLVHRWLVVDGPTETRTEIVEDPTSQDLQVKLLVRQKERWDIACSGVVRYGDLPHVDATTPSTDGVEIHDPYETGSLFHGPAFRYVTDLTVSAGHASATLDPDRGTVPHGALGQGQLDATTHLLPHDSFHRWDPSVPRDKAAYPLRIPVLRIEGPLPEGRILVEARYLGRMPTIPGETGPATAVRASGMDGQPWISYVLVEVLVPKGPIGSAKPEDRMAFLRDRRAVPGLGLATREFGGASASLADVRRSDWLPGTIAAVYRPGDLDLPTHVAVADAVADAAGVHPGTVKPAPDLSSAVSAAQPLTRWPLTVNRNEGSVHAAVGAPFLDLSDIETFWSRWFGVGRWPVEDLYYGLIRRFVRSVRVADPDALAAVRGRSCLYLANHQVGVESLLFSILASGLTGVPTVTLAKAEHRTTWLGTLIAQNFRYPGVNDPEVITFFDRDDKASLPKIIGELAQAMMGPGKGVMVHVEGTRSLDCRTPVVKMSGAFLDMAIQVGAPVVPVKFVGGLPTAPMDERIEFPFGGGELAGQQDIWLGKPILPETLASMPLKERKEAVIGAINGLGPSNAEEAPLPGDPAFAARVREWQQARGVSHEDATLYRVLEEAPEPTAETRAILDAGSARETAFADDDRGRWLAELARRLTGPV